MNFLSNRTGKTVSWKLITSQSVRKDGKMTVSKHENNNANRKDVTMNGNKTGAIFYFIGIGIVLVLLVLAEFISRNGQFGKTQPQEPRRESRTRQEDREIQKKALENAIRQETEQYLNRNRELLKEFEMKIASAGKDDFERARQNIPGVTRNFSSIVWNGKLCYKMAKDRLCKSNDTRIALNEVLKPAIIGPCEDGSLQVSNELENFLLQLAENENQFHARLALCIGNSKFYEGKETARKQFLLDCHKLSEKLKADAVNRVIVIAGTGIEIICLHTTVKMTGKVFGHIIARLAATGSTAAVCAAADGPLPIGDAIGAAIGIGSLVWCACDLYQISQVMPREVHAALTKMVRDYQVNSRKQALEFAQKTLAEYQAAAGQIKIKM